jgi:hypothetical protein
MHVKRGKILQQIEDTARLASGCFVPALLRWSILLGGFTRLAQCRVPGEPFVAQRKIYHRPLGAGIVHLFSDNASFFCSLLEFV